MKCKACGQPMLPKGKKKKPNEYDHAQGCPLDNVPCPHCGATEKSLNADYVKACARCGLAVKE